MGRQIVYKCDDPGCKQEWTPTNHWFHVGPLVDSKLGDPGLEVIPFNPKQWSNDFPATDKVFCGTTHTLVYLSKELQKMHEPSVAPATLDSSEQAHAKAILESLTLPKDSCDDVVVAADKEWKNREAHGADWRTDETGTV